MNIQALGFDCVGSDPGNIIRVVFDIKKWASVKLVLVVVYSEKKTCFKRLLLRENVTNTVHEL